MIQPGAKISFEPYQSPYFDTEAYSVQARHAVIKVPAIYPDVDPGVKVPRDKTLTLDVRIFAYKSVKPNRILFNIPGGPGQKAAVNEANLRTSFSLFRNDTAIVLLDHRGVGKSSKILPSKSDFSDLNSIAAKLPFPLQAISIDNAANDIIFLAKTLLNTEYPGLPIYGHGVSYGTELLNRVVQFDPNLFHAVLLEGMSSNLGLGHKSGYELLENCHRHPSCRPFIGSDYMRLLNLAAEIDKNRKWNECIKEFRKLTNFRNVYSVFLQLFRNSTDAVSRTGTLRYLIPLLLQLESCSDVMAIKKSLSKLEYDTLGMSEAERPRKPPLLKRANYEPNHFAHWYISFNEFRDVKRGDYCNVQQPSVLCNRCNYEVSSRDVDRIMGIHGYRPDPRSRKPISSAKTKVYVVNGVLDFITPIEGAQNYFDSINAQKVLIPISNGSHNVIVNRKCYRLLVQSMIGNASLARAKTCFDRFNAEPLDWNDKDILNLMPKSIDPAMKLPPYNGPGEVKVHPELKSLGGRITMKEIYGFVALTNFAFLVCLIAYLRRQYYSSKE